MSKVTDLDAYRIQRALQKQGGFGLSVIDSPEYRKAQERLNAMALIALHSLDVRFGYASKDAPWPEMPT